MAKLPTEKKSVSEFLHIAKSRTSQAVSENRLIFAMDATASRESTWDLASKLHGELFTTARRNNLAIQLVYYRGFNDFFASSWSSSPEDLLSKMQDVRCRGGATQIVRLMKHIREQASAAKTKAAVFIGDCCEENPEEIFPYAGELALFRMPLFIFQEGHDPTAKQIFSVMAERSGGAHVPFTPGSAKELADLLGAVSAYATSGTEGVRKIHSSAARKLLQQLKS